MQEVKTLAHRVLMSPMANPGMFRIIPGCIQMVARTRKSNLTLIEIADACEASPLLVRRWYHRIVSRLGLELPEELTPTHFIDECVCRLLSEAAFNQLQLKREAENAKQEDLAAAVPSPLLDDEEVDLLKSDIAEAGREWDGIDALTQLGKLRQRVSTAIQRLLRMASEQLLFTGRHPGPIAVAATMMVIQSFPDTSQYANLADLVEFARTSVRTVKMRTAEFKSLILKQAIETLPWTENLSLANLESKLPMILNHLEVEARVKTAKMRIEAQEREAAAAAATRNTSFLPTVSRSSKKTTKETHFANVTSVPQSPSLTRLAPSAPSMPQIPFEPASLSGSLLIQAPLPNSTFNSPAPRMADTVKLEPETDLSLDSMDTQPSTAVSTTTSTTEIVSSGETPIRSSGAKYTVRLGSSPISRLFPSTPTSTPANQSSSTNSLQESLIIVKPEIDANGRSIGTPQTTRNLMTPSASMPSRSPIVLNITASEGMEVDQKQPDFGPPPSTRRSGKDKKEKSLKRIPSRLVRSFAPAFMKNESIKSRRSNSLKKVKRRLSLLARSLTEEQAQEFGLSPFRSIPVEEEVEDQKMAVCEKQVAEAEENQIERLLMEGASDEQILSGYLDIQLEALDSHYNAVTEQYTNYTDALIRTSDEIAILEQMKAELESDEE